MKDCKLQSLSNRPMKRFVSYENSGEIRPLVAKKDCSSRSQSNWALF